MLSFNILAAPAGFIISDKAGSDPMISYELLRLLSSKFGVIFYAVTSKVDVDTPLPKAVSIYELPVPNNITGHATFILKYYLVSKSITKREKINIIHHITFHYGANFNPLVLSNINIPFIIGPAYYDPPLPSYLVKELTEEKITGNHLTDAVFYKILDFHGTLVKNLSIRTIEKADMIIAVNNVTSRVYANLVGNKKIRVIPIGVNIYDFQPSLPPRNGDILVPAALIKARGIEYAIKALPKILKEHKDAKLHIVGDGVQKPFLIRLCKQLGIQRNVFFHGYVNHREMKNFYSSCRLVVLPSILQSFGNVLLEAMASGRPCVTTEALGPREIVINGETGYVVPIADSDTLAEAISRLLSDYELCYRMGKRGRKLVEEKYSWDLVAEQYYRVYKSLV